MSDKIHMTLKDLRAAAIIAEQRGTESAFITIAIEWAGEAAKEVVRLKAEVEALRADAERYRWLRDECTDGDIRAGLGYIGWEENSIDAAIDAARAK